METYLKRLKNSFLNIIHVSDHFRPLPATLKTPPKWSFLHIFKIYGFSAVFLGFSAVFDGSNHQKSKKHPKMDLKTVLQSFLDVLTMWKRLKILLAFGTTTPQTIPIRRHGHVPLEQKINFFFDFPKIDPDIA